jgi:hypothetical protein
MQMVAADPGAGTFRSLAQPEKGILAHTPADALFLHRKPGGLYLLAARLGARVDVRSILERHLQGH